MYESAVSDLIETGWDGPGIASGSFREYHWPLGGSGCAMEKCGESGPGDVCAAQNRCGQCAAAAPATTRHTECGLVALLNAAALLGNSQAMPALEGVQRRYETSTTETVAVCPLEQIARQADVERSSWNVAPATSLMPLVALSAVVVPRNTGF